MIVWGARHKLDIKLQSTEWHSCSRIKDGKVFHEYGSNNEKREFGETGHRQTWLLLHFAMLNGKKGEFVKSENGLTSLGKSIGERTEVPIAD